MDLTFRIFKKVKHKGWNLTRSEKISYYCLISILALCLLNYPFEKSFGFNINPFIFVLLFFGHIIGMIIRFNEYENLNGFFDGKIEFDIDRIIINEKKYFHYLINNLSIVYSDYYGSNTGNTRYGPMYTNGVTNKISFYYDNEFLEYQFEINDSSKIDKLDFYLIDIICNEKISYQRSYLNLIPEELRDLGICERFIFKLIKEKRINETEGLLIIGYNSDKEFIKIKDKYDLW